MRFWAVAILCTIPPFAIGTFYVYICIFVEVDNTYGIKYFNVLCTGVTIAIGLVVYTVRKPKKSKQPVAPEKVAA